MAALNMYEPRLRMMAGKGMVLSLLKTSKNYWRAQRNNGQSFYQQGFVLFEKPLRKHFFKAPNLLKQK